MHKPLILLVGAEGIKAQEEMIVNTVDNLKNLGNDFIYHTINFGKRHSIVDHALKSLKGKHELIELPKTSNPLKDVLEMSKRMAFEIKYPLVEASKEGQPSLYMEADKFTFVADVPVLFEPILSGNFEVALASRSKSGFQKFPLIQRVAEKTANTIVEKITGISGDYMYGPRAFSPKAGLRFQETIRLDWGTLTYPIVSSILAGDKIKFVEVEGYPQPNYMAKYGDVSFVKHLGWRVLQNYPHILATFEAKRNFNNLKEI